MDFRSRQRRSTDGLETLFAKDLATDLELQFRDVAADVRRAVAGLLKVTADTTDETRGKVADLLDISDATVEAIRKNLATLCSELRKASDAADAAVKAKRAEDLRPLGDVLRELGVPPAAPEPSERPRRRPIEEVIERALDDETPVAAPGPCSAAPAHVKDGREIPGTLPVDADIPF